MPAPLEAFVSLGFTFISHAWSALTLFCVLGLAYLLGGHHMGTPMHSGINRTIITVMVAILVFAVIYIPAVIYAQSFDRSFAYGLYSFVLFMGVPCLLSIIGVGLAAFSRYPLPR